MTPQLRTAALTAACLATVGVLTSAVFASWYLFGGGAVATTAPMVQQISDKVASDAMTQYRMAQRSGSPMDVCTQAMMVSSAYLQAKNEPEYAAAKTREKADCAKAGFDAG